MNYLISVYIFLSLSLLNSKVNNEQQKVLQSIFDIEEFQNYLAYSPRFVSSSARQEVMMMTFPELKSNDIRLKVREKSIKIITNEDIKHLNHNFFIKIDEFDIKKSNAKVLLSYQNARMYHEKKQKILLDATLIKDADDEWIIDHYNLYEVSTNTSD